MEGYVKSWRKAEDSAAFQDETVWKVWSWLLWRANWKDSQMLDGTIVRRGELVIGQQKTAEKLRLTRRRLRTALDKLQKCQNVTIKSTKQGTHITICNYDTYQDEPRASDQASDQRATNERPTSDQRATTYEEGKKIKKGKKKEETPLNPPRGKFRPPTFDEVFEYCQERGNDIAASKFIDHFEQVGWVTSRNVKIVDWKACVRTWEHNGDASTKKARPRI